MATTRHNVTTGLIVWGCVFPVVLLSAAPRLNQLAQAEKAQSARREPQRISAQSVRDTLDNSAVVSDIPYQLVSANRCTPVVSADSPGLEVDFLPNVEVVTSTLGGKPVPPGEYVCNRKGQAAVVGVDQRLKDISHTPLKKLADYQSNFDLLRKLREENHE